jgi:quinol monooxygenase YgiN
MIVVVGRLRTDAERRGELIELGERVAAATRQEDGCINYRLYGDTASEHDFVVVEEWDSEEALQRHFTTAHIDELMSTMPGLLVAAPDVKFHTVESTRDLSEISA